MIATSTDRKAIGRDANPLIQDLRQSLLEEILRWLPPLSIFAFLYAYLLADQYFGFQPVSSLIATVVGVLSSAAAYRLRTTRPRWAGRIYVSGLTAAVLMLVLLGTSKLTIVLLPPVILLSLSVLGARAMVVTTALCTIALVVFQQRTGLWEGAPLWPFLMVWLTTVTAWISQRGLIIAADWALSGYEQARRATEEARRHRGELARTLHALDEAHYRLQRFAEQLADARDAAEEARRAKQLFVANVSHELRTPLNIIIGFSEMVALSPESYGDGGVPRQFVADMHHIYRSARHLRGLIDDVLDLSRVNAHQMPLVTEHASLVAVIHEVAEMIRPLVLQKGIAFDVVMPDEVPDLFMDPLRVRQVLLNLLNNAVRFTDEGRIAIRVAIDADVVRVDVEDTGPGIPAERISELFEEFRQLDPSMSRTHQGFGLGLALSQRFIQLHGGRMWVDSVLGEGSCFHFTLPLDPGAKPSASAVARPLAGTREPSQKAVLVTTEDPLVVNLLKRHLDGYQVVGVPHEDLERGVRKYLPRAVIVNDGMGDGREGFTFAAQEGGGLPERYRLPLVHCALPDPAFLRASLGVDHYLIKPVTRARVLQLLDAYGDAVRDVLIVDDDAQLLTLLSRIVRSAPRDYAVDLACGGSEGLMRLYAHPPDLVLLDLMMEDVPGLDVVKYIRHQPALQDVRIAIVSARDMPNDHVELLPEKVLSLRGPETFTVINLLNALKAMLDVIPPPAPPPPPAPTP